MVLSEAGFFSDLASVGISGCGNRGDLRDVSAPTRAASVGKAQEEHALITDAHFPDFLNGLSPEVEELTRRACAQLLSLNLEWNTRHAAPFSRVSLHSPARAPCSHFSGEDAKAWWGFHVRLTPSLGVYSTSVLTFSGILSKHSLSVLLLTLHFYRV